MAFGIVAIIGKILTLITFGVKRRFLVNGCPKCLTNSKSLDHLSPNCKAAQNLCYSIMVWFDCSWVIPIKFIMVRQFSLLVIISVIWKEGNLYDDLKDVKNKFQYVDLKEEG